MARVIPRSGIGRPDEVGISRSRMFYYVYILKSTVEKRYYIGSTENIEERIAFHNSKRARWTKRYQPWVLVHSEEFQTRSEAVKRERFLKSLKGIERNLEKIKLGEL